MLLSLARKLPDLQIYASVHDVITTNPEISMKNCLLYSSDCTTWFTSSTNRAFSLQHPCGLPTAPIFLAGYYSAHAQYRSKIIGTRVCDLRALSSCHCHCLFAVILALTLYWQEQFIVTLDFDILASLERDLHLGLYWLSKHTQLVLKIGKVQSIQLRYVSVLCKVHSSSLYW